MKKTIFLVLIIMVLGCISIANVFASSGLTLQETIDMMSQPVQIVDGMYDNYTDSVYGNENANYGNTIAIGFTRCAFLSYNYPYESRLDYIWDSTNESVATVTEYGTITALSVGTTTIRVIDKYKMGYLATLDISVYQATFTDEITVQLSTDLNLDPSHNGTEVIYGLGESAGNYIHVGYSRSICIVGPAPSISRQDYIWTIDNPIAFVSIYGMVYAHTPGEATITGVNKYNSSYVGRILIRVLG